MPSTLPPTMSAFFNFVDKVQVQVPLKKILAELDFVPDGHV